MDNPIFAMLQTLFECQQIAAFVIVALNDGSTLHAAAKLGGKFEAVETGITAGIATEISEDDLYYLFNRTMEADQDHG